MDDVAIDADPFEVLAHPTRVRVLAVLAEALRDSEGTVGFADLRRRVGVRDSGNFNYHLGELRGRFVHEADGGYRITATGLRVVAAALAGAYDAGEPLGPTSIADACPVCGERLAAQYANGMLTVSCPDDHGFRNAVARRAVEERGLAGATELLATVTRTDLRLASDGLCPVCHGPLQWGDERLRADELDPAFPHFATRCGRCGAGVELPVVVALLAHPAVGAFYHDRGVAVHREPIWSTAFYEGVTVANGADSGTVAVSIELEGDVLTGTLDDELTVVSVDVEEL